MEANTQGREIERISGVIERHNYSLIRLIKADSQTIAQFGRKIGIPRQTLSGILHGTITPNEPHKIAIAKGLGLDSRAIFPEEKK